jgi:proline iminopeptidase
VSSSYQRFSEFRRSLPRTPRLVRRTVESRGLHFAVFATPEITGALPLVCVNGGLIFSHQLLWPALSPLAYDRQLILYDQRGRGETSAPPGPRSARIEHDAGDLVALRHALGIKQWDILGHSWGGGISMLASEQDRGAVHRLVLVNAVGPTAQWLPPMHARAMARLSGTERDTLGRFSTRDLEEPDAQVHAAYASAIYPAWFNDQEMARRFAPPPTNSATGAHIAARLRRDGYDWRERISQINAKTLVVHGESDLLPPLVATELAATIPGARLALIPDAGHMPFWESPEPFFAAVQEFLGAS